MSTSIQTQDRLPIIGWREWVALPDLNIPFIKSKVDTGARSSSLHALDIEPFQDGDEQYVRFRVPPHQRSDKWMVTCEMPVHDVRSVRSSSGETSLRYVIRATVRWKGRDWLSDVTLADRSKMGFRMLLGRETLRGNVLVDSARSYFGGRLRRKKKPDQ